MTPEKFTNHSVFEKLQQLEQLLSTEKAIEKIPVDDILFFNTVLKYVNNNLKITLPVLIQETELNAISAEIDAGKSQINNFLGNNNRGHINNAINNFHSVINKIKNIPYLLSKSDFNFSKSISNFEQTLKNKYQELDKDNAKLKNDLKNLQDNFNEKQKQIVVLEEKIKAKEIEIQNVLSAYNTEYESIKSKINTDVENEKQKFNKNFDADRKLLNELIESDRAKYKKDFEDQKTLLQELSSDTIGVLNTKLFEANKIVNIIGNIGVTGNYQKIADDNKKNANYFRLIALFFMIVMSGLLIWSIIDLSTKEFDLSKSIARMLAAAILIYPAIYAAKESNKHRLLETQNRKLELELASIGPFIELLPEDKKQKIKEDLVNKFFGNNNLVVDKNEEEDVGISSLERILKALLPIIKSK